MVMNEGQSPNMIGRAKMRRAADRMMQNLVDDPELIEILVGSYIEEAIARGELLRTESLTLGAGAQVVQTADLVALQGRNAELELAVYNAQVRLDEKDVDGAVYYLDQVRPPEDVADEATAEPATAEPEEEVVDAEVIDDELLALGAGEPDGPLSPDVAKEEPPAPDVAKEEAPPSPEVEEPITGQVRDPEPEPAVATKKMRVAPDRPTGGGDGVIDLEPSGRPRGMPDKTRTHPCERIGCKDKRVPGEQAQFSWTRFRIILCRTDMLNFKEPIGAEPDPEPEAEAS